MKIQVWDTYVKRSDGLIMHFDILVPEDMTDESTIFRYGMEYLKTKPFDTMQITSKECEYCHMEEANQGVVDEINNQGYSIIEMENCH